MAVNTHLKEVINKILTKELTPVKIYRSVCSGYFSINIESESPKELVSIFYNCEEKRDKDFSHFDNKVFAKLTFNPYRDEPGFNNTLLIT